MLEGMRTEPNQRLAGALSLLLRQFLGRVLVLALLACPALAPAQGGSPPEGIPAGLQGEERADASSLPVAPPARLESAMVTLAPGDVVNLTVYGRPELASTLYVSDTGYIDVPLAGAIPVNGLSPPEASARVATAFREGEFLVDPQVNIVLGAVRSQQISIVGEVSRPGRYPIETRTSILDALALAGGITERGEQRAFILRRSEGGVDRFEIDLADLLNTGAGQVVELRAGDTVVVPKAQLFYVYGAVRSPGAYAIRDDLTVVEAITLAGGMTDRGSANRVQVKRKDGKGKSRTSDIEFDEAVMAEDVINVRERIF